MSKMVPTVLKLDLTNSAQRISSSNLWVKHVTFQGALANVGNCAIGKSDVALIKGHNLDGGQSFTIDLIGKSTEGINLYDVYAISDQASGDDLLVTYLVETGV